MRAEQYTNPTDGANASEWQSHLSPLARSLLGLPPLDLLGFDDPSPLDRPFAVTAFADQRAGSKMQASRTLRQLADKIAKTTAGDKTALPWLKLARFGDARTPRNSLRHDANVVAIMGVEADYDGGEITPEEARDLLHGAGLTAAVYTTPSDRPDKPRWRAILPSSRELPPARRAALVARLNGLFGGTLDGSSFTLSQSYYFGGTPQGSPVRTFLVEGRRYIDEAHDLDAGAIGRRGRYEANDNLPQVEDDRDPVPPEIVLAALAAIQNDEQVGRDDWIKIISAVHHEMGEDGREAAEAWSASWTGGHDPEEFARVWESILPRGNRDAGAGTILRLAKRDGWRDPRDRERFAAMFDTVPPEPGDSAGLVMLSPDECELVQPAPYVIKGFVSAGNVATIVGSPGVGKSALTAYLAYRVAQGERAFGMRTKGGKVLYVAAEAEDDMRMRVRALKRKLGPADDFKLVLGGGGNMQPDSDFLGKLRSTIRKERPALVVIDTLAAAFGAIEENSSEGMGRVLAVARSLAKLGPAVIIVHHDTKAGDGLPRGHGSLHGDVDANLSLTRDPDGTIRGVCSKSRRGVSHQEFVAFGLGIVSLGGDEDGDAITTVVVEEREKGSEPKVARLSPSATRALNVFSRLAEDHPGGVPEDDWRKAGIDGREVSTAPDPDSRRRVYQRAVQELVDRGRVEFRQGRFFLPISYGSFPDMESEDDDEA